MTVDFVSYVRLKSQCKDDRKTIQILFSFLQWSNTVGWRWKRHPAWKKLIRIPKGSLEIL